VNFFFLIYCSTFSFTLNVRLRLTLEFQTIFLPKLESLPHWYILICTTIHTFNKKHVWNLYQEDFRYRDQIILVWVGHLYESSDMIPLLEKLRGETPEKSHNNETWVRPTQGIDVTFNPKPYGSDFLGLFLICCLIFPFLLNFWLRLILGFLTLRMMVSSTHHHPLHHNEYCVFGELLPQLFTTWYLNLYQWNNESLS